MAVIPNYANSIAGFGYTPDTSISSQKKSSVLDTSNLKKQALSGNYGAAVIGQTNLANDPEIEEFRNLTPMERSLRYGREGTILANTFTDQVGDAVDTDIYSRDGSQILGDSALSVGQGAINTAGGIAALGAGIVSPEAGNIIAGATRSASEYLDSNKSRTMTDKNDLYSRIAAMREEDSQAQYEADLESGNNLPGLRKFGRDIVDAASDVIRDPAVLTDMTAQGIGSLAPTVAAGVLSGGNPLVIAGVTGAMGAGEGYTQTQQEIMEMSDSALRETSEPYRQLRDEAGLSEQDAKIQLANTAGIYAGALSAPLAAVGGRATASFAGNPLRVLGNTASERLENIGKTIIKEGAEEFGQGSAVQLSSNIAQRDYVDPDQDLMSGVAQAGVTEGLAGIGTAGTLQGPGAAVSGAVRAATGIADAVGSRLDRAQQTVGQRAAQTVAEAANNVAGLAEVSSPEPTQVNTQEAPTEAPVTETNDLQEVSDTLTRVAFVTPEEVDSLPEGLSEQITENDTRFDVLNKLKDIVYSDEGVDPETGTAIVLYIKKNIKDINEFVEQGIPENIQEMEDGSPLKEFYTTAFNAAEELINSAEFIELNEINLNSEQAETVDATSVEGAEVITDAVKADPVSVSVEKIEQAKQNVNKPVDRAALDVAGALIPLAQRALVLKQEAQKKYNPNEETLSTDGVDAVREEIIDSGNSRNRLPSLRQHITDIISALDSGNPEIAQVLYNNLADFTEHMQNKVEAYNESFRDGGRGKQFPYRALTPQGWMEPSNPRALTAYYNSKSNNSMYAAEATAADAELAHSILSRANEVFSPLGITPREVQKVVPDFIAQEEDLTETTERADTNAGEERLQIPETQSITESNQEVEQISEQTEVPTDEETDSAIEPTQETSSDVEAIDEGMDTTEDTDSVTEPPLVVTTSIEESSEPMVLSQLSTNMREHTVEGIDLDKNFKFDPKRTNLFKTKNVFKTLSSIIRSNGEKGISARLGSEVPSETREHLLGLVDTYLPQIVDKLNENAKAQFTDRLSKEPRLLLGREHTNLLFTENNTGEYPEHIASAMAIAGFEWAMSLSAGNGLNVEDISKITGVPVMDITPDMIRNFNKGVNSNTAVQDIKARLSDLLGFSASNSAPIIYGENILDGLATEVLTALTTINKPLVETLDTQITISNVGPEFEQFGDFNDDVVYADNNSKGIRTYKTLAGTRFKNEQVAPALRGYYDALSSVLVPDKEPTIYIGKAPDTVDYVVKKNKRVKLSKKQRKALKNIQNTPYKANTAVWDVFDIIGSENLSRLLGYQEYNTDNTHVGNAASIEGKNTSIMSSIGYLDIFKSRIADYASQNNIENIEDVPVFFKANVSRVSRVHLEGMNPQSNKLLRETIVSTEGELDLSDPVQNRNFWLSVAQSIGEKVHKMSLEDGANAGRAAAEGRLAPAVAEVRQWLSNPDTRNEASVQRFMSSFEGAVTPKDLHAIVSIAKYQNAEEAGGDAWTKFKHTLALEADGITDGPLNALAHFWSEHLTGDYLDLLNAGGKFLGKTYASVNDYFSAGNQDIYEKILNVLNQKISDTFTYGDPEVSQAALEFFTFISGVRELSVEDSFEAKRNEIKNPATVFLYGSGVNGINDKIVSDVRDKLYDAISWALNERTKTRDNSINLLDHPIFKDTGLSKNQLNKAFKLYFGVSADTATNKNWQMPKSYFNDAMLELYTKPMYSAIEEVMGSVASNMKKIIKSSQVQAIVAKDVFERNRDQLILDRFGKDALTKEGNIRPYYYGLLTPNDYNNLYEEANAYAPTYMTEDAQISIGARERALTETTTAISSDRQFKANLNMPAMGNIGVSAAPNINIGVGDGQMMTEIYQDEITTSGTLPVFDGVELMVSDVSNLSEHINKSVYQMWQKNPFNAVQVSFDNFLKVMPALDDLSDQSLLDIRNSLKNPDERRYSSVSNRTGLIREIGIRLDKLKADIDDTNARISARKELENKIPSYSDHMAVVAASYENEGDASITPDKYGSALSELYQNQKSSVKRTEDALKRALSNNGRAIDINGEVVRRFNIGNLITTLRDSRVLTNEQTKLLRGLAQGTRDTNIFIGSREALNQHKYDSGSTDNTPINLGQYDPQTDSIYLVETNAETLLHELVHAATFNKVDQYYNDPSQLTDIDREAIQRLEGILNEVQNTDLSVENASTQQAIIDMMDAIDNAPSQAHKLNEFMAWTMANQNIGQKLKATPLRNKLLRATRELLRFIRNIVVGRNFTVGSDVLSNIRFNLDILTSTVSTVPPSGGSWTALNLTKSNPSKIRDRFTSKLKNILQTRYNKISTNQRRQILTKISENSRVELHRLTQAGFNITPDEQSAFRAMFAVMSTNIQLNPNSLNQINKLYEHILDNLKVESFIPEGSTNPNDRIEAENKYQALTAVGVSFNDPQGRSVLLPSFLALTQTNDDFRNIVNKIPLPVKANLEWTTADDALNSIGSTAMNYLSAALSGQGRQSKEMVDALDNLALSLSEIDEDASDSIIEQVSRAFANFNTGVAETAQGALKGAFNTLGTIATGTQNTKVSALARVGQALIAPLTNETAEKGANFTTRVMNVSKYIPRTVQEFWNEIQGITLDNEGVIGLSKRAKSFVAGLRQDYREVLPKSIRSYFKSPMTKGDWTTLHTAIAKTDIAALLDGMTMNEVRTILGSRSDVRKAIKEYEGIISKSHPSDAAHFFKKAKELAKYMVTKESSSNYILRNPRAIASKLDTTPDLNPDNALVSNLDKLISLYALDQVSDADLNSLKQIIDRDQEGIDFIVNFLKEMKQKENSKVPVNHPILLNTWKGYIPDPVTDSSSLIVVDMRDEKAMRDRGYLFQGLYHGVPGKKLGYFYNSKGGTPAFQQGALQNVVSTLNGVNVHNGRSIRDGSAYATDNSREVAQLGNLLKNASVTNNEAAQPIFNDQGNVIGYEFTKDPSKLALQQRDTDLPKVLGIWRGRQIEEAFSQGVNDQLLKNLKDIHDKNIKDRGDEFINLAKSTDPIHRDIWNTIPRELKEKIEDTFGPDNFPIRNDMINNAVGYRSASVGDVFSGNTRIRPEVQNAIKRITSELLGPKVVQYLTYGERIAQKAISEAKNIIVIRSIIVPAGNIASNVIQLMSRGVPLKLITKGTLSKLNEINQYVQNRKKLIDLEAQLTATNNDPVRNRRIKAEIQSIKDAHRRMSIWPIIDQFSTIAEDLSPVDGSISSGEWFSKLEAAVDKLPKGLRTLGKYSIIHRDTALYKLLDQATQYGDFLAKAVMYDHLINQGMNHEDAVRQITDEFVNYDYLPGRVRTYLDSTGITWFWNFKVRTIKIALNMIRNNPLTALFALSGIGMMPNVLGSGSPITDNLLGKITDGGIHRSIGWDMLWDTPSLLPIGEIIS